MILEVQLVRAWIPGGVGVGPMIEMAFISGIAMRLAHIESYTSNGPFFFSV